MGKLLHFNGSVIRLIVLVLGLMCIPCGYSGSFSNQKISEVERKLKQLSKHSIKAIKSEDGDIIDCIDIKKQPALGHPALKHHKVQMIPTYNATKESSAGTRTTSKTMTKVKQRTETEISQIWQKSGTCSQGTIPVRRIRKKDLLKVHSIEEYGRKKPSFSPYQNIDSSVQQKNHSKAILFALGYRYLGGKGDIIVFNPFVETDDEYSTSQVALINGAYNNYELVEAGWAVNPSVYGDRQTRLFAYWTVDGSIKTGCFDLTCPGFVQTSNEIALGAAINLKSIPADLTYQITIYIYKDPYTNNWWLQYNEKNMGYWPAEIFSGMRSNAESVEWGGEVYSKRVGTRPHTATHMGSGQFPDRWFGTSGTVTRMRIKDNYPELKTPVYVETFSDEYYCYNARYVSDYVEDPEFYYGGPGRNPMCP
ncbi:hypothetical protein QN277_015372 [Acacia crassicarpa]|uniref:Neprosin PEP catalytic domain-containing protein n=1 Tax=Acacia crassicarpa TaxID=499986 RepID=A0AAE1MU04_9FABA|nr:hypothetical protein QN277_015372 [Acacia crassicarpa]